MRVLHCLSRSSLGGGQVVVFSLMRALRDMNENIHLGVALPAGGPYVDRFRKEGFETYTIPFRSPFLSRSRVRRIIDRFAPDILHTHESWAGFHVRRAVKADSNIRTFHTFHGFHVTGFSLRFRAHLFVEDVLAAQTNALICLSESEANEVHRIMPQSRGKILVIQNSVDVEQIRKDARLPLPRVLETWFSANSSRRVISMIARPTPVKNHTLAFAAVDAILKSDPRYAFLFVGMPPSDRRYKRLKKRFRSAILAVPYLNNIAPVIARSWSLFLPSVREASPLVVLEGFSLGVPTIGTKAPGIVDVVQDRWNGFLIDPIPEALQSVLSGIDRDEGLYESACKGATEQAGHFRMRSWARQYVDAYALRQTSTQHEKNP